MLNRKTMERELVRVNCKIFKIFQFHYCSILFYFASFIISRLTNFRKFSGNGRYLGTQCTDICGGTWELYFRKLTQTG